jgi:ABC-type Fe3+ transport system substrate-binding protein
MKKTSFVCFLLVAVACGPQAPAPAPAPTTPPAPILAPAAAPTPAEAPVARTARELYQQLQGKSRDEQLAVITRGARQEGKLDIYSSGDEDRVKAIVDIFSRAFPFIQVTYTRGSTRTLTERFITQAKAGQPKGDLFYAGVETLSILRKEGLASPYLLPDRDKVPAELRNTEDYWVLDRLGSHHVAYNTVRSAPDKLPDTFEGFAAPEWRGRFSMNSDAKEWWACMVKSMGQEPAATLVRRLVANNPVVLEGKSAALEQMTLGAFDASIDNTGTTIGDAMKSGAPVNIKTLNPLCMTLSGAVVAEQAANPNAALLYLNYSLSEEMQKEYGRQGYYALAPEVPLASPAMRPANPQYVFLTEADVDPQAYGALSKLHEQIVVRKQ